MSDTSNLLPPDAATNSDPFAGGSTNPDIWRNLMMFGAAMSQAGAKPGSTFASSLGAGVQGAIENARTNAQSRSQQNLTNAQTQGIGQDVAGKQLGNAQQLYNIQQQNMMNKLVDPTGQYFPQMQVPNTPQLNALQQPSFQQPMQQAGGAQTPSGPSQMAPQAAALQQYRQQNGLPTPPVDTQRAGMGLPVGSASPATMPSSTQDNGTTAQPQESQGIAGPTWGSTPGNTRLNPQPQTNSYPAGSSGTPAAQPSPGLQAASVPGIDPDALRKSILIGRGMIQPSTPAEAYQAVRYATNPDLAKALSTYAMAGQTAASTAQATLPYDIAKAGGSAAAEAPFRPIDARQGGISGIPGLGIVATGRLEGESPTGAKYITQPSITQNGQPIGASSAAGTGMIPQTAASSLQPNSAISPSSGINLPEPPPPDQAQGQQPEKPGAFGIPAGATLTGIPESYKEFQDKNYPLRLDLSQRMMQYTSIDQSLDTLKDKGWLAPGAESDARLAGASGLTTVQNMIGAKPTFGPGDIAAGTQFIKSAQTLTNAAAHDISSRGTNFDIVSGAKANPQYSMPYIAGLSVNTMKSEADTRKLNQINYIDQRMQQGANEQQATNEFDAQQPGDLVVKRAESQIIPVKVNAISINKLLPGTKYVLPGGQQGYIPIPKDYPFKVPDINPLMKAQTNGMGAQ